MKLKKVRFRWFDLEPANSDLQNGDAPLEHAPKHHPNPVLPTSKTGMGILLAQSNIERVDSRKDSWPVLKFLLELCAPCEQLLPHFEEYGIRDGTTLLAFFRMGPARRKSILEDWVKEKKITAFQSKLLEIELDGRHADVTRAFS